jgi:uncharacterized protein (TIGR02145 family)
MKTTQTPGRYSIVLFLFSLLLIFGGIAQAQDKGTFVDKRDNHSYKFAKIGKQVWMVQNLNFATPAGSWYYNNNDTANTKFGRLYDWNTAIKACPKGWHMPTDVEWTNLIKELGGEDAAGGKFQEFDTVAIDPAAKKPEITGGFSSLLGGVRHGDNTFTGISFWGGCWSATLTQTEASNYLFVKNNKGLGKSTAVKTTGYYLRCVRTK